MYIPGFAGLGKRGEEVQVRRGFARNYLVPSKRAVYNTEHNRTLFEAEKVCNY